MTSKELIEDFEKTHPCVFSRRYKELLAMQPVEVVSSKLNEIEHWLAMGGKVVIT